MDDDNGNNSDVSTNSSESLIFTPEEYNIVINGIDAQTQNELARLCAQLQVPPTVNDVPMQPQVQSTLPAVQNWPGHYGFNMMFEPSGHTVAAWTYSTAKDRLYIQRDIPCPINFTTSYAVSNVFIRVKAHFSQPEFARENVTCCFNHVMQGINDGLSDADHLVRAESSTAIYQIDPTTNEQSVVVPFDGPPSGQLYSTYIFRFLCLNSCVGINRRPITLIFTLEKDNQVIGRRRVSLKVCSCPGRDRRADERPQTKRGCKKKKPMEQPRTSSSLGKRPSSSISNNEDPGFVIRVRDQNCYNFLVQMKRVYEMSQIVDSFSESGDQESDDSEIKQEPM